MKTKCSAITDEEGKTIHLHLGKDTVIPGLPGATFKPGDRVQSQRYAGWARQIRPPHPVTHRPMDSMVVFLSWLPSHVTKDQVAFRLGLHGPYQSLELFEGSDGLVARVEMKTPTQALASDDHASQLLGRQDADSGHWS